MGKYICLLTIITLMIPILLGNKVWATPSISVSAEHAVLMDAKSGRVLYEKDAYDPSLIASTTKIMTAIIAIEAGNLKEKVSVSERATHTEGSSIYLTEEEKISLQDLVYGLLLRSGNDSAIAIAEHVGGSVEGFIHLMNEKARWLGMNDSHFENPHGLDGETHYSSAYDLGLLMSYAMKNKTFRKMTSSEWYKSENRAYSWKNKNKLLTTYYKPTNGGKTGYTKKAGRTLVSSAEKEGMNLIAVTLNAPDDWNDHERMYEWGFKNYETYQLQREGIVKANGETYYLPRDIYVPLTLSERKQLQASFQPYNSKETGNLAGKRHFKIGEKPLIQASVFDERPKGSFLVELTNYLKQMMGVSPWST